MDAKVKRFVLHDGTCKNYEKVEARKFKKDVIRVGEFYKDSTGQTLDVTPERMDAWVEKFNQMLAAGIDVEFPVDHSMASDDNKGFVEKLWRDGDTLWCVADVPLAADAERIGTTIKRASISVTPGFVDDQKREWGEVIDHIAPCTKPVVSGQGNFIPLRGEKPEEVVVMFRQTGRKPEEETTMADKEKIDLKKPYVPSDFEKAMAKALGVDLTGAVDQAMAQDRLIQKANVGAADEAGEPDAGTPDPAADPNAPMGGACDPNKKIPPMKREEDPANVALRTENLRLRMEKVQREVTDLLAVGKITPAQVPATRTLLAAEAARTQTVEAGEKGIALSRLDESVSALFRQFTADIPENGMVDLSKRVPDKERKGDDKAKSPEELIRLARKQRREQREKKDE